MLYILLPAYNEENSIDGFFYAIRSKLETIGYDYKIIVCNDGSSDKTMEKLKYYSQKMPITIISHKFNRGLGETARDLFEKAAELCDDTDVIVRMDCDNTHEPKYLESLINKLDEGYDVVIASRFAKGGGQKGVTPYRAFISWCATLFMKIFFPVPSLREYTCGFRAYKASIIKRAIGFYQNNFIQLKGLGFTCTLEKIVKLKLLNARITEVPFVLRYDKKQSTSKMVSSITMLGYFAMVILDYWPWGGWKQQHRKALKSNINHEQNSQNLQSCPRKSTKRNIVSLEPKNSKSQTIDQPKNANHNVK
jgi:dolichol-phosphate mannosyltransferase